MNGYRCMHKAPYFVKLFYALKHSITNENLLFDIQTAYIGDDLPHVEDGQGQPTSPLNAAEVHGNSNGILALTETHESPKKRNSKRSVIFRRKDELTDRQQREANLGTILVCISLLFILCQSIKIIPDVSNLILQVGVHGSKILQNVFVNQL